MSRIDLENPKYSSVKDYLSKDGCDTYKYSYQSAGRENVEEMKRLATLGQGLNTFYKQEY